MGEVMEGVEDAGMARVADLLGGGRTVGRPLSTEWEAHLAISHGLPRGALLSFVDAVPVLGRTDVLDKVIGISLRTLQRHRKGGADELLSREQSGRLYRAAEIVAKARDVLGSNEDAERFLEEPAMALDGQRPIDLLSTPVGADLVEKHLERLDYGVYT